MEKLPDYLSFVNDKEILKVLDPDEKLIFSDKLQKFNSMDWKQERNFVLTNKFIYNFKKKNLKRRISFINVAAVTISENPKSAEFVLHVPTEYDYRYDSPKRDEIVNLLRRRYFKLHAKSLPLYSVPLAHLKQFASNNSQNKRIRYTIPEERYRAKEIIGESDRVVQEFDGEKTRSSTLYKRQGEEKTVSLDDFKILKKIGRGSFGTVYLAQKLGSDNLYAMKQLAKDVLVQKESIECTRLEKEILRTCCHPFLAALDFVFQTTTNIYFIMKYYRGGDLYRQLAKEKRFSEARVKFYGAQVALALGQLHDNDILYRDVKPENILMDIDGYIALTDFGLAKVVASDESACTFVGTSEYIAPEIINGVGHNKPADWWSFGVLLYEMLVGAPPFRQANKHLLYFSITRQEVSFPDATRGGAVISAQAKDLIARLLHKIPEYRLGTQKDAEEVLSHPFFKELDRTKLLAKQLSAEFKPTVADEKLGEASMVIKEKAVSEAESGKYEAEFGDF